MRHNEVHGILNRYVGGVSFIFVKLGKKTIKTQSFSLIHNKKVFINWLYGSFSLFSDLSILEAEAYEFEYDMDDDVCYGDFKEVKSVEVTYDGREINIANLVIDCLTPNASSLSLKIFMYLTISLSHSNLKVILSNDRLIANLLLKLNRPSVFFNTLLNAHCNIWRQPLLICNLMIPMDTSYLEEDE